MAGREFWVVYDYGMGGVWGVATASSEAHLASAFPELQVADQQPEWMTPEREQKVRFVSSFIVGEPNTFPTGFRT